MASRRDDLLELYAKQRPARGGAVSPDRFIVWLDEQRFGPMRRDVRRVLDDIAVAAVDATDLDVAALDLGAAPSATPLARWQRLSSSLKAARVALWLDVKPRSIGVDAEVWIGHPQRCVASPAVAAAVERLLRRSGTSPAAVAALYEDVAARARPTRSLWIDTVHHIRRGQAWTFSRPTSTTTKKKSTKKKSTKKKSTKKKSTKKKSAKKTTAQQTTAKKKKTAKLHRLRRGPAVSG